MLLSGGAFSAFNTAAAVGIRRPSARAQSVGVELTLANRLRFGALTEDGLAYKEKLMVRSYDFGIINKTIIIKTMANLLQVIIFFVTSYNWISV